MSLNIKEGISLKIEGELGKYQTLPVDDLIKISSALQNLILCIATFDLSTEVSIDLNNFKLELTDFKKSSSLPSFVLSNRHNHVIGNFNEQRDEVNKVFNNLLKISDIGDYYELKSIYPDYKKRNQIVSKLFDFTSSFNGSPVYIFEKDSLEKGYNPKKFKSEVKNSLMVTVKEANSLNSEENAVASVRIVKNGNATRKKIVDLIETKNHSLSYSPEVISVADRQYELNFPLRCLFEKIEGFYVINNELLDIIGTGKNQSEAEENFNEEFDFLYNRLITLTEDKLSKRLIQIKGIISMYVKKVS